MSPASYVIQKLPLSKRVDTTDIEVCAQNVEVTGQSHKVRVLDNKTKQIPLKNSEIADEFLELASEQRLEILEKLKEKSLNISKLAKLLGATNPEVHRNVGRLTKSKIIEKNTDGNYQLTTFGKAILSQIPTISFLAENRDFSFALAGIKEK